jgi:hypothetical protein
MNLDQLIEQLEQLRLAHGGDVPVVVSGQEEGFDPLRSVQVLRIKRQDEGEPDFLGVFAPCAEGEAEGFSAVVLPR